MGYANIQADSNFYRQSLNADGVKYVTGPYTSLYEDVFRAVTVTTDSVVSVTSYVGDSLSSQFLLAGTEIYGLFSSVTIHSGKAVLHLAGASYISEIINQYSATGIPLGFYEEGTQCLSQKISALLTQGLFDDASWVMVPSQYEEDWVRAFKPTSELGNLAFTRSSDATFTDSTGVVRRSPWNLLTWSEMFSDAAWTKSTASVSANTTIAPNGTLTADTLTADGASNFHAVLQTGNSINGITYTHSIYAKKGTNDFIQLIGGVAIYTSGLVFANFDLNNGVVGSVGAGTTATITNVGDGWYRCTMTATATATASSGIIICSLVTSATSPRVQNNTLSTSVFLWGAQLVEGTEALPYFATTDRLNVPRLDYRNADGTLSTCPRLLLEPQRTNSIRNSSMVGAVAGSPGTWPTNWLTLNSSGLTRSIVGVGTENGLPYIDVRLNGIATNTTSNFSTEQTSVISASSNQVWANSSYVKIIAQPNPPVSYRLTSFYANSGAYVGESNTTYTPTTTLTRFNAIHTATASTITNIYQGFSFELTIGQTYDFTIRIAAPQMELGAYATTWVPTTTTAVTRIADTANKTGVASLIGQTEGTMFAEINLSKIAAGRFLSINNGVTSERILLVMNSTNTLSLLVVNSGTAQASLTSAILPLGAHKVAAAYNLNDFVLYVDGVQIGTDNSGTVPACSDINVGNELNANQYGDGIAQAALFPVRLDNATLAALTTL